jgi:hypothetical protein
MGSLRISSYIFRRTPSYRAIVEKDEDGKPITKIPDLQGYATEGKQGRN